MAKKLLSSARRFLYPGLYILAIVFLPWKFFSQYDPDYGYTWAARFGSHFESFATPALQNSPHYRFPEADGYDGQFYAQLALHPSLMDENVEKSVDNFSYRARRMLFSWTAFALGLGNPDWILQAYCIQNILFWLLLAGILVKWLPPSDFQNLVRFVSILYSVGLIHSVTQAVLDGPSLLLIAISMFLLERGHKILASLLLGVSVLGKETNLLASMALSWLRKYDISSVKTVSLMLLLLMAPFGLWFAYGHFVLDVSLASPGNAQNFAAPLSGWGQAIMEKIRLGIETRFGSRLIREIALLVAIAIQAAYFIARPKPRSHWWRLGVVYAVLMTFLGFAVWEGSIGAAPRILMPMTLAFNLLFTRQNKYLPILLMANIPVYLGYTEIQAIPLLAP